MENHTKRIRKARRQGQARKKDVGPPTGKAGSAAGRNVQNDLGEPNPRARKKALTTTRKTKRQGANASRQTPAREVAAGRR